ncbi:MAG: ATPase domain-containing protein [Candidatus Aenigmatarchaeota archaeon]
MRITTGLPRLDKLTEGGFPSRTVILLSGGPGTGKTLIGLNFLVEGAAKGERCYYLSVSESKEELLRACESITSLKKAKNYIDKNLLIECLPLGEKINLEQLAKLFLEYPKVDRLVIDNVNKILMHAKNKKEYRIKLSDIIKYLKEKSKCSLLICETVGEDIDSGNSESFEVDGVLHISFLDLEEKPKRTLEICKLRYTSFDPRVNHELFINKKGLKLSTAKIV